MLQYWEENTPGDPRETVGNIYAQCKVCGRFKKNWEGIELVPPYLRNHAHVVELADTEDSKSSGESRGGSNPSLGTNLK